MSTPFEPRGVVVPMITPVTPAGTLDEPSARRVIDWLIAGGVDGIFVLGTTGEGASVPHDLRARLVALAVEQAAGRCRLYAGISSNCVAESIAAGRDYLARGVDALVAHLPAYFALNGAEMVAYYRRLADALDGPLVVYNMPLTTHMSMPLDALQEVAEHPRIVGVKDSENDPTRLAGVVAAFRDRSDFAVLIGPSSLAVQTLQCGADGVVPSSGNLAPHLWSELVAHARAGRWPEALALQSRLDALTHVYQNGRSLAQSMAALKAAMAARRLCGPAVLPPLATCGDAEQAHVAEELASLDSA